ncbi:uncharacterized protein LOC135144220 [Zophobas morio]|uniref:uncharacterized protein LOC135144220 n=1 Tax=Zophobas morio TaxID=2755281 RepID=UPI003083DF26
MACTKSGKANLDCNILFPDLCNYDIFNTLSRENYFLLSRDFKDSEPLIRELEVFQVFKVPIIVVPTFEQPSPRKLCFGKQWKGLYLNIAVGGTFDHLHFGHKILLTISAYLCTTRLICGVSGKALLSSKKYSHLLETYQKRCNEVHLFLNVVKRGILYEFIKLEDKYGPLLKEVNLQALVVTEETEETAKSIIRERVELGLPDIDVITVDLLCTGKEKLSSTNIRKKLHG